MTTLLKVHEDDISREVSAIYGERVAAWVVRRVKGQCRVGGTDFLFCRYDYLGDPEALDLFPGFGDSEEESRKLHEHNREWVKANPDSAQWWRLGFSEDFTAEGFDRDEDER